MNKLTIVFGFIIIFLFSCKKAENIGQNLLPEEDFLKFNYSDTFVLATKTVNDEPLRTDKFTGLYLGSLSNATYGKSIAKILFEFSNPLNTPADTLAPFTIDSTVLFLKYTTIYGDTLQNNDFVVKKLNTNIAEDQIYLSNQTDVLGTTEVGRANNLSLQPSQKIKTFIGDTIGTTSVIRIPMETAYAQEFINKIGDPDSTLLSFAKFDAFFRGIEVHIENANANTMALINLNSLSTKLSIFYRDKNDVAKELVIPARLFSVGTSLQAASINNYTYNISTTVQNAINSTDATDSINYIIGQNGTLNKITLPNLSSFQQTAFNRAELLISQYESNTDTFQNLVALYLIYKNNSGEWQNATIGIPDSVIINDLNQKLVRYTFNITKLLNDINLGKINTNELFVSNHFAPITQPTTLNAGLFVGGFPPTKIVVGGSNNSNSVLKTKLRLYYSKK